MVVQKQFSFFNFEKKINGTYSNGRPQRSVYAFIEPEVRESIGRSLESKPPLSMDQP